VLSSLSCFLVISVCINSSPILIKYVQGTLLEKKYLCLVLKMGLFDIYSSMKIQPSFLLPSLPEVHKHNCICSFELTQPSLTTE
jgi:hypothetical protein